MSMNRLTKRAKTSHENGVCCTHFRGKECNERAGYCTDNCPWEEAVWAKLADYEDLGFTPEEIAYMAKFFKEHTSAEAIADNMKTVAKLLEWSRWKAAEEEGRLVVLPVKVGDTVWFIRNLGGKSREELIETVVEKVGVKSRGMYLKLTCNAMYETSCNSIGKTVFLTKAEAEAALEKMKGEQNE